MNVYEIIAFYKENKNEISAHAVVLSERFHLQCRYEKIPQLPDAMSSLVKQNTVLCILDRSIFPFRKLIKYIYLLNKPVIIVHRNDSPEVYHTFKLPVGYLQENKEKVVWANFFQRNNPDSQLELVIPGEKDEGIAAMVENNMKFIENIFKKSGAHYKKTFMEGSFEKNLKKIFQESNDCVIFIMRPFRLFSIYIPYTIRLFRKYAHTPTMIIPRDESLYIPCH